MPVADTLSTLPRGPHRLTREEVTASQRGRLLRAMVEAVAEKGYARVAVADVIARAGVSRATFYASFADKEACFLAAYDTSVEVLLGQMGATLERVGPDGPPGIADVLGAYLEAIAADPVVARTFLIEVYAAGPVALARRYAVLERFVDLVSRLLSHEPQRSEDPAEHRLRCEAIVGAISSMVTTRIASGDTAGLAGLRDPMLRFAGLAD